MECCTSYGNQKNPSGPVHFNVFSPGIWQI
jgi:hypothetical protein